jgi:hypothetical protein
MKSEQGHDAVGVGLLILAIVFGVMLLLELIRWFLGKLGMPVPPKVPTWYEGSAICLEQMIMYLLLRFC